MLGFMCLCEDLCLFNCVESPLPDLAMFSSITGNGASAFNREEGASLFTGDGDASVLLLFDFARDLIANSGYMYIYIFIYVCVDKRFMDDVAHTPSGAAGLRQSPRGSLAAASSAAPVCRACAAGGPARECLVSSPMKPACSRGRSYAPPCWLCRCRCLSCPLRCCPRRNGRVSRKKRLRGRRWRWLRATDGFLLFSCLIPKQTDQFCYCNVVECGGM